MIILFTDFGIQGPYQGELAIAATRVCSETNVVSLFADAPHYNPLASAHLLAAYMPQLREGDVVIAVVDPGVGSDERLPVAVNIDGRWLVGPDNGLFDVAMGRASEVQAWRIDWRPERLSNSFHGRDLFAPVAARLACGLPVAMTPLDLNYRSRNGADSLAAVIYIDAFGNAMTGIPVHVLHGRYSVIDVDGVRLPSAETFSDMPAGEPFWYVNSCGLVELAVNQGSARELLQLAIGSPIHWVA